MRLLCLLATALLSASLARPAQFPGESERLMATARLWVTVQYFHPYLAYRDIDWDKALVMALPKIRSASNPVEYRDALSGLLEALHDPETYVLPAEPGLQHLAGISQQVSLLRSASELSFVVHPAASTEKIFLDLPGLTAVVRLSEPLNPIPPPVHVQATSYTEAFPKTEARILAAIKTWGSIHYFFAYKDLVDEDWDEVFATYLPKFAAARDATDYNLTFADLLSHLTDSNTTIHSQTLDEYFGQSTVGLRVRLLDKYPIVTEVLDPAAVQAGVRPGDIVKRVANESITDRFRRFVQYVPASTPQRSGYDTIQKIAGGPVGSDVELSIENAQGEARPVKLTRSNNWDAAPQRLTEPVRVLSGKIGYLDLDRLSIEAAGKAMDQLQDTRGILLDLRGRAPAAAYIASRLNEDSNTAACAILTTPIALHPDVAAGGIATQTTSTFEVRTLPAAKAPRYAGKTIALIDERTIGESEYAGLLFEAANKTEFVGVPSAGAESTIAEMLLPGRITLMYSTQDVRHGNGGKLQRLGLQPQTIVPSTAHGLRAGKDEPLEAALSMLSH